jgi:DNA-binding transcriptional ArsR family regulator
MVNITPPPEPPQLDRVFAALADPTRRAILARVARDWDVRVTDLAAPFRGAMSLPAVSKHLRVLERAGLLRQEKNGRVRHCRLTPGPLRDASEWLAFYQRFWADQLDSLAAYIESEVNTPPPKSTENKVKTVRPYRAPSSTKSPRKRKP